MPIIDASVLASYLVRDEFFDEAKKIFYTGEIIAPDLIIPESMNVVWKHVYLYRRISIDEAVELIKIMKDIVGYIELINSIEVIDKALELAVELGITIYDSVYLATAIYREDLLNTFDEKFKDKVMKSKYKGYIKTG